MKLVYLANVRMPTEKAHGLQIMQMCSAFASEGHEVTLLVPDRKNAIEQDAFAYYGIEAKFQVVKVPIFDAIQFSRWLGPIAYWVTEFSYARSARRVLQKIKPELTYSRDTVSNLWNSEDSLRVVELHTLPKRFRGIYALIWKMSDRVIVTTEGLREDVIALGLPEDRVVTAHDAVNLKKFQTSLSKEDARRTLNLPQDKTIAIYIGRFYKEQGIETLIKATEELESDTLVVLLGGTHEKGDSPHRKIVSKVPHADIPKWLRAADIALMPYTGKSEHVNRYASPMKLFEYLGAGLPIISSDLPSVREVLNEDQAVFVPAEDSQALTRAIDILASDKESVQKMSTASAKLGEKRTWRRRAIEVVSNLKRSAEARKVWMKWWPEAFIVVLALSLRLIYVLAFPQQSLIGGDSQLYLNYADWMRGATEWPEGAYRTFQAGYPAFLAFVRSVAGESLMVIRIAQAFVSTMSVALVVMLGRKVVGRKVGIVSGMVAALYAPFILESGIILTETIFQFFILAAVYTLLIALENSRLRYALLAGAMIGLAGFVRELGFYLGVFLVLYYFVRSRSVLRSISYALSLFGVILATAYFLQWFVPGAEVSQTPSLLAKGYEVTLLQDQSFRAYALDPTRILMYPEGIVRYLISPYRLTDLGDGISIKSAVLSLDFQRIQSVWLQIFAKANLILLHWIIVAAAIVAVITRKIGRDFLWIASGLIALTGGAIILGSVGRPSGFIVFEPLARYRFPLDPLLIILAVSLLFHPPTYKPLKSILAKMGLMFIGLMFSFTFMEGGLRIIGVQGDIRSIDPLSHLPILPQSSSFKLRTSCFDTRVLTNHIGFHDIDHADEKPEGVIRVAVLGDSFIEGIQVSRDSTFSRILEKELNNGALDNSYEVLSFGMSGSGSYSSLLYYREYAAKYQPEIVILGFYENDLENDHTSPIRPGLVPVFENGTFVDGPVPSFKQNPLKAILRKSSLILITYRAFTRIEQADNAQIKFNELFLREETDVFSEWWMHEEEILKKLSEEVQENGGQLIIMGIPSGWRLDSAKKETLEKYDFSALEKHLALITEKNGISFIPLIDTFQQYPQTQTYLECDGHWSKEGHAIAALVVAEYITQE